MKCELCESAEATVHFKQICNGKAKEMYVCESCAAENGFDLDSPLSMPEFLFGPGGQTDRPERLEAKTCPACGLSGSEFRKRSLLGCARCYETFADELMPYLRAMQKGDRHSGKVPAGLRTRAKVEGLRKALEAAVAAQDFEEAATLRDRIHELEAEA